MFSIIKALNANGLFKNPSRSFQEIKFNLEFLKILHHIAPITVSKSNRKGPTNNSNNNNNKGKNSIVSSLISKT